MYWAAFTIGALATAWVMLLVQNHRLRSRVHELSESHSECCVALSSTMALYSTEELFIPRAMLVYEGALDLRLEKDGLRITARTVGEGMAILNAREECEDA